MITDNKEKKLLIEKLLQDKVIDIDQAFMLLEQEVASEQKDFTPISIGVPTVWPPFMIDPWVQPFHHPYNPYPMTPWTYPGVVYGSVSIGTTVPEGATLTSVCSN